MKLTNIVVQFTVTIPEIEVDKESGLLYNRARLYSYAEGMMELDNRRDCIANRIIDCPDYPALCDETL